MSIPEPTEWLLLGSGRVRWCDAVTRLDSITLAWADLDGFHIESPPVQLPPTTHLWGWAPGRCVRIRPVGGQDEVILAELVSGGHVDGQTAERVLVRTDALSTVSTDDKSLPKRESDELDREYEALTVLGTEGLVFFRERGLVPTANQR